MSKTKKIEFQKENLKDFHFLIKGLQPISENLSKIESDLWEYVHACLGDRNDWGEDCTSFESYKRVKIEFFMEKIVVHFADMIGEKGYFFEDDDSEEDEGDYKEDVKLKKGIAIYDLITGELTDMFDRTWDSEEQEHRFECYLDDRAK